MADLKNDWQESDIVMNTDMNDIANAVNSKLNSDFSNVSGGAVPIANGGTGATTAENARNNLDVAKRDFSNVNGILSISNGGTGATTTDGIKNNLGLGNSSWVTFGKTICASIELVDGYPYIDFSPNSQTDFEVRIAKNGTNQLNIEAANTNAALKINNNTVNITFVQESQPGNAPDGSLWAW